MWLCLEATANNWINRNKKKSSIVKLKRLTYQFQDNKMGGLGVPLMDRTPRGSQVSFRNAPNINTVVDWDVVRRKYRIRFGGEVEKPDPNSLILSGPGQ